MEIPWGTPEMWLCRNAFFSRVFQDAHVVSREHVKAWLLCNVVLSSELVLLESHIG